MRFIGFLLSAFIVLSCVSKTVPNQRFTDSEILAVPTIAGAPADPNVFSFAIVGDLHVGDDATRLTQIATQAAAEGDAFIILLGDTADEGKSTSYAAVQNALNGQGYLTKFLSVIGNHDVFNDGWDNYKSAMGRSHYTVSYGNSQFIALDTADGTLGETQYDWLEGELKKSKPTHTFILSHYLPVIPGQRTYLKLANEEEAMRVMRLSQNYSVRAWLGAHYHSYINETIENVTYVVAGGGGGRRMEPIKQNFFVQVLVNGDAVSYQLRLLD